MDINTQVNSIVESIIADIQEQVKAQVLSTVQRQISAQIAQIDFRSLFNSAFKSALADQTFTFPSQSIPAEAIDVTNLRFSGDNIAGGIITNFGSTGIDDKSTACQLSIFDEVTVIENNLLTKDLTVKGTTTIEGDLNVTGTLPEDSALFKNIVSATTQNVRTSLNQVVFSSYADMVLNRIQSDGLDLNKIKLNGADIVEGNTLSNTITQSNLQKVGQLKELQVQGETLLSGSLYTSSVRVGINTIEPTQALSIWDQEVEIGFGKKSGNTAIIEAPRPQTLIISANGKNNLTLTPDGDVTVNKINMGSMSFTSASVPPSNNQPAGSVVFNSNPSLGGPLGWVSLGDARWANFGIID